MMQVEDQENLEESPIVGDEQIDDMNAVRAFNPVSSSNVKPAMRQPWKRHV